MSRTPLNKLLWIEELLPPDVESKRVPGGLGYYYHEKLILILTEESRTTEHKGRKYPFELWFGAFFPIEKIKQSTVCAKFPYLENHPGKKNALYLAAETEEFETLVKAVLREIFKGNRLFGQPIKETAREKRSRLEALNDAVEVDTRRPSLFNTGPVAKPKRVVEVKSKVKKAVAGKKPKVSKKSENAMILGMLTRKSR